MKPKNGLVKDDRSFEWQNTQLFDFSKKGQKHVLIKPVQEKEIALYAIAFYTILINPRYTPSNYIYSEIHLAR